MKKEAVEAKRELARQHTQVFYACAMLDFCLDGVSATVGTPIHEQLQKVNRWMREEEKILQKFGPLSVRAEKKIREKRAELRGIIDTFKEEEGVEYLKAWSITVYAAELLIFDCGIVCPLWAKGRVWRFLSMTAAKLRSMVEEFAPGVDEAGTELYERLVLPTSL